MGWLTDRFIRGVTRRVSMPLNEVLIGASGILELADDMIAAHLVPKIVSVREEYFVVPVDVSLAAVVAAGGQMVDIPYRAVANGLRDLKIRPSAGQPWKLSRVDLEQEHLYRVAGTTNAFYLRADQVGLLPPPTDATWTLELWHEQRPSKLTTLVGAVEGASGSNIDLAVQVLSADAGASTVTATSATMPSGFTGGALVDVVRGKGGHRLRGIDLAVTAVAAPVVSLAASATPADTVAGDFLAVAGYSPVIQLPDECCIFLESLVAARCMTALGDLDARTVLTDDEQRELQDLLQVISPRVQGEPVKTVNRHGLLRGRRGFIRRGFYG